VSTVDGAAPGGRTAAASRLDILVNNAGAAWGAPFDEFPESGWDKVVDLNMKTPFFLTQALHGCFARRPPATQPAKVINIASIDGISVNPWETYSYAASKAGLIHLTKRMALRLIQDGIVVSGIAPGPFASEMNKDARDHGDEVAGRMPAGPHRRRRRHGRCGDLPRLARGRLRGGPDSSVDGGVTLARG
jgi:NAD(P)-dependent dehydrogenase (short-subunit alcohol dehydrogenase family)